MAKATRNIRGIGGRRLIFERTPITIGGRPLLFEPTHPFDALAVEEWQRLLRLRKASPTVRKLSGKEWAPAAYARSADKLLAMGITGASEALAEESRTAPDCAKPLKARYIEKLLRELGPFQKAYRGSPGQRPK